jgi:predicted transcriptional regulator
MSGCPRSRYTTVMTMMNVLERKGHLRKKVEGRSFDYRPT